MQYNVCIWALSDYNEQEGKNMPLEINIFLFFLCLLELSPGIINLMHIKIIIFCIPCAFVVFFPDHFHNIANVLLYTYL